MIKKCFLISLFTLFCILCFVFNRYDLNISITLTKYYNSFYEFFDDFGEIPIYIGPIMFGAIYFFLKDKKYQKLLCSLIVFVMYLVISIKVIHNKEYSFGVLNISLSFMFSLLITLLTLYLFSKTRKETLNNIKDLALLGVIVSAVSFVSTEILKYLWGRVRFRDLSENYQEFTTLFSINGINGHKSFPSGHTNAGTSILLIALLTPRFTSKKWVKYLVFGLCFAYIAILAFSRIVVSAHYASDVLFGFVVGFSTICITYSILKRKGVINVASNKC